MRSCKKGWREKEEEERKEQKKVQVKTGRTYSGPLPGLVGHAEGLLTLHPCTHTHRQTAVT